MGLDKLGWGCSPIFRLGLKIELYFHEHVFSNFRDDLMFLWILSDNTVLFLLVCKRLMSKPTDWHAVIMKDFSSYGWDSLHLCSIIYVCLKLKYFADHNFTSFMTTGVCGSKIKLNYSERSHWDAKILKTASENIIFSLSYDIKFNLPIIT